MKNILKEFKKDIRSPINEQFENALMIKNIMSGYYYSIASVILLIIMIILTLYLNHFTNIVFFIPYYYYLFAYLLLAINASVLFVIARRYKDVLHFKKPLKKQLHLLIYSAIIIYLIWGTTITVFAQFIHGQITVYIIIMVSCSITFTINPIKNLIINILSGVVLLIILPLFQSSVPLLTSHYINIPVFVLLASLGNLSSYQALYKSEYYRREAEQNSKTFKDLSEKDELTGLYNRRMMRDYIEREIIPHRDMFFSFGVAMLDVDYFKKYNDYYGHMMGDKVLNNIGNILLDICEQYNAKAFRYGGEEFIILFENPTHHTIINILEFIKSELKTLAIEHSKSSISKYITMSMGFYLSDLVKGRSISDFIQKSDTALLIAKEQGRNRIVEFK